MKIKNQDMEMEIKLQPIDEINIIPIVYFLPENFNKEPLHGNCKYAALSDLSEIRCHQGYVDLVSHRTPIINQVECESLLIFTDDRKYSFEVIDNTIFVKRDL